MRRPNITAIRERADNATEGPWVAEPYTVKTGNAFNDCMLAPGTSSEEMTANSAFIAASRTDVPAYQFLWLVSASTVSRTLPLAGRALTSSTKRRAGRSYPSYPWV